MLIDKDNTNLKVKTNKRMLTKDGNDGDDDDDDAIRRQRRDD